MRQKVAAGEITTLRQFAEKLDRQRVELEKLLAPLETRGEAVQEAAHGLSFASGGRRTTGTENGSPGVLRGQA